MLPILTITLAFRLFSAHFSTRQLFTNRMNVERGAWLTRDLASSNFLGQYKGRVEGRSITESRKESRKGRINCKLLGGFGFIDGKNQLFSLRVDAQRKQLKQLRPVSLPRSKAGFHPGRADRLFVKEGLVLE